MIRTFTYGSLALTCLIFVLISACSKTNQDADRGETDVEIASVPVNLAIESDVAPDQTASLKEAVSALYRLPLDTASSQTKQLNLLMSNVDASPTGLQAWLEMRVHYIIKDNFDFDSQASFASQSFTYQFPNQFPDVLSNPDTLLPTADSENARVAMSNMGTARYAMGKLLHRLVNIKIPGVGTVSMTSPRTGLLEIGPGLFFDTGNNKIQNIALDIFRLGILFHEARHSDGHGHTLGFMHSICPAGHDFAGLPACDAALNGAYSVGASLIKSLRDRCVADATCTERSRVILGHLYADQANRVIDSVSAPKNLSSDSQAGTNWNDAPEGTRSTL